jgi:hypothetical protein
MMPGVAGQDQAHMRRALEKENRKHPQMLMDIK